MFGLEYLAALSKIAFQIAFAIITAIPAYFAWGVVPIYFPMIPQIWYKLPYWHIVGILLMISIVAEQIRKLTPKIISIDSSSVSK